jgi:hypothetical protein
MNAILCKGTVVTADLTCKADVRVANGGIIGTGPLVGIGRRGEWTRGAGLT